eukprot:jgi/Undpi1/9559/HiC_scaffold_27.g12015.m1
MPSIAGKITKGRQKSAGALKLTATPPRRSARHLGQEATDSGGNQNTKRAIAKDTSASVKDDVTIVAAERRTTASSSPTRMQCEVEAVIVLSRGRQGSGDSPNLVKVPGAKLKQDTAGGSPGRRSDYGVGERDMGGERARHPRTGAEPRATRRRAGSIPKKRQEVPRIQSIDEAEKESEDHQVKKAARKVEDAAYQNAAEEFHKHDKRRKAAQLRQQAKAAKADANRADLGKAKESLEIAKRDRDVMMRERETDITAAELDVRHGSEAELREEDEEISSISENLKSSRKARKDNRKYQILKDDPAGTGFRTNRRADGVQMLQPTPTGSNRKQNRQHLRRQPPPPSSMLPG